LISKVQNCEYCWKLEDINLSFNRITSTKQIYECMGNVKRLQLRANGLKSTEGLERLFSLESLDLTENSINNYEEMYRLKNLPLLTEIWFRRNPISLMHDYRM